MNNANLQPLIEKRIQWLNSIQFESRLANRDGTLWSSEPETIEFCHQFTGWVDVAERTLEQVPIFQELKASLESQGITDVVVLGMGGSSLSALMFAQDFPNQNGLKLHVLDSTNPEDVRKIESNINKEQTVFIVASKSGSTVEPFAMEEYFFHNHPSSTPENYFIAITDPSSEMESRAKQRGYRNVFLGEPEVGGRFSVFSPFGIIPATLAGYPVEKMLLAVIKRQPNAKNSVAGIALGSWMAELAISGINKITVLTEQEKAFGLWAEQLVAESTGKSGVGILPIALEPQAMGQAYGPSRAFYFCGTSEFIEKAKLQIQLSINQPFKERIVLNEIELAELLFDWEIATAVAGAILEVNPFDQPNVQQAKLIAKSKLEKIQAEGTVEIGEVTSQKDNLQIISGNSKEVETELKSFLGTFNPGDHIGILAFLPETPETTDLIQIIRSELLTKFKVATTLGYGPRYLHSTGQFHKGGPNDQKFIVLTSSNQNDFEIPGFGATFGQLKTAQALGDIEALRQSERPLVHVHLSPEINSGLKQLGQIIQTN